MLAWNPKKVIALGERLESSEEDKQKKRRKKKVCGIAAVEDSLGKKLRKNKSNDNRRNNAEMLRHIHIIPSPQLPPSPLNCTYANLEHNCCWQVTAFALPFSFFLICGSGVDWQPRMPWHKMQVPRLHGIRGLCFFRDSQRGLLVIISGSVCGLFWWNVTAAFKSVDSDSKRSNLEVQASRASAILPN